MPDKIFTDIESRLISEEAKQEHARIWKYFKDIYNPTFLSAYLTYLQTFANVHNLLSKDVSSLQPRELYSYNNAVASVLNQHNSSIKMLGFSPAHQKKDAATKTGRKLKDTSLDLLR